MKNPKGFYFFSGDVNWIDYGGTWIRKVGPRRWHFIEHTNMDDACPRDNEGFPKYIVELSEVDLNAIPASNQNAAWRSCDGDCMTNESTTTDERDLITAGACFQYGAKAPLDSHSTDNARKGYAACRAESYRLTRDASAYREAMAKPVNRLGSTAAEYMTGDINAATVRGCEAGDPSARLIAKMYVNCDGQTLGGQMPESELNELKAAIV